MNLKTLTKLGRRKRDDTRLEPTWDIALLYPTQGNWSVEEYLALDTNRLVEFSDGVIEVLPMPTTLHQWIVSFLHRLLYDYTGGWSGFGLALFAPLRIRLWKNKFREPDVAFMLAEHRERAHDEFWEGADVAMEIVSDNPEDRKRDLVTKRAEYARARISDYWIVDLRLEQITVLRLKGKTYDVHGVFKAGQRATSRVLPGFEVDVASVFAGP